MGEEYKNIYRLYNKPSFWEGVARLFDFKGILNQYNYSASDEEADRRAIESDWQFIGEDLRQAISQFKKQHNDLKGEND